MTNRFVRRRLRNTTLTLLSLAAVWLWVRAQERNLSSSTFTTGYLLLIAVTFLALYNLRKKLPSLPLGSSAAWLQWHLYVGMASMGVFALHIGPRWPNGMLDLLLAATYLATVASGLVGLYLTRTIPAQLTRVGTELVYERIAGQRGLLRRQAGELVLQAATNSGTTTLADFFAERMYDFFYRPRGIRYMLRPTTALRRNIARELRDVRRYLSEQEQAACEKLFTLVRRKDDMDFHEARQKLLKLWLFVHIGLSYALLSLAVVHALLAHAFHGGAT